MPIEVVEPAISFIAANIAWITVFVYAATIVIKLAGYDEAIVAGYSYMELLVIGTSTAFLYFVISPSNGIENILDQITGWVVAITVLKPLVLNAILD